MQKKIYQYKRFWLILLILAYLIVGFFYLPKIIKNQIQTQMQTQLAMETAVDTVRFNPLTFTTSLEMLSITDRHGENWFNAKEFGINFDPLNLIRGEWKFSDLNLNEPQINILTNLDGQVVVPALPEFPESEEPAGELNLTVEDINIEQGRVNIQANNVKEDFAIVVKHLKFDHEKFNLLDEDTLFQLAITTENNEVIELNGHYNHVQQLIESELNLSDWQASTLNRVLPDHLMVNNQSGLIQADGSLNWPLSEKPVLNFSEIELQNISSTWNQAIDVTAFNAVINDTVVDTQSKKVQVSSFESSDAAWQVKWPIEMTSSDQTEKVIDESEPQWQVNVENVTINDWPLEIIDQTLNQNLDLTLNDLNINDVNTQNQPFNVNSQLQLTEGGIVDWQSEQSLEPFSLSSEIKLQSLELQSLSPWIEAQSGLVFAQGTLQTEQQLTVTGEQFGLQGTLSLGNADIENNRGQDIMSLSQLIIGATDVSSEQKTIIIDQITLDQAQGNIIIDEDKNINIQNLKQNETEPQVSDEPSDWVIKVGSVNFKDSSTALIDKSITPAVTTSVSELNGEIKGLSSESLSKADVEITGKFNQFSPLSIKGKINPLSSDAYTDLKVVVQDLDLLAFSPYSTKTVAFPINGGKLDMELEYNLNKHELKGKNNLLFKQFKLGDKTPSPDVVDLPLKLAVSLLTGMNGEMKINLPVSGNITDPEFSYGSLVGKAFFKLITSIVASPFKILGALIPNPDPNLSDIQFASGSAELIESEKNKLNQIAEIMAKKSNLNLQLNPQVDAEFDQKGLQLSALLTKAPFEQFDTSDSDVTEWLQAQLTPEELATYTSEDGQTDFNSIWKSLLQRQVITDEMMNDLTTKRNNVIKNYLLESAGITAEKVFVEKAVNQSTNLSMIKIGVSQ